jgi:hypothetical protein
MAPCLANCHADRFRCGPIDLGAETFHGAFGGANGGIYLDSADDLAPMDAIPMLRGFPPTIRPLVRPIDVVDTLNVTLLV